MNTRIVVCKETGMLGFWPNVSIPDQKNDTLTIDQMKTICKLLKCIQDCWENGIEIEIGKGGAK